MIEAKCFFFCHGLSAMQLRVARKVLIIFFATDGTDDTDITDYFFATDGTEITDYLSQMSRKSWFFFATDGKDGTDYFPWKARIFSTEGTDFF